MDILFWNKIDRCIRNYTKQNANTHIAWYSEPTKKRGSKTIVCVQNDMEANELFNILKGIQDEFKVTRFHVKVIECAANPDRKEISDITLSMTQVPNVLRNQTIDDIKALANRIYSKHCAFVKKLYKNLEHAESLKEELNKLDVKNTERLNVINQKIDPNKRYIIFLGYKQNTYNYRMSYNCKDTRRKKQTNVGDVVIAINGNNVKMSDRIVGMRMDKQGFRSSMPIFDIESRCIYAEKE